MDEIKKAKELANKTQELNKAKDWVKVQEHNLKEAANRNLDPTRQAMNLKFAAEKVEKIQKEIDKLK